MLRLMRLAIPIAVSAAFYAAPAQAQATRTFVSGVGDDVNPCSRTAPCQTLAGAISKTAAGGEINCLDPTALGTVTITKSITIDCRGTFGSTLNSATTGVTVNGAGIVVVLRNIGLNGGTPTASGLHGIRFIAGASLTLENVVIKNDNNASPNGNGILFQPNSAAALYVNNLTIVNNGAIGGGSGSGIELAPGPGGSVRATIQNSRIINNSTNGIRLNAANGAVTASISDSIITGNAQGVVLIGSANPSSASIVRSDVSHNSGTGILAAGAQARARVANSTISDNATGVNALAGASINTFGNNRLNGNGADGAFTLPALTPQ